MSDSIDSKIVKSEATAESVAYTGAGVELTNLDAAWKYATIIAKSDDMCPKAFKGKPEAVLAAMQTGAELGIRPMQSLASINIIEGTPTLSGATLLALMNQPGIQKAGKRAFCGDRLDENGEPEGFCWSWRAGDDEAIETVFTKADAVAMKLWMKKGRNGYDTPWVTMPGVMLGWRATSKHSRIYYSDVTKGLYMTEELVSVRDERRGAAQARDVTPSASTRTGSADPMLRTLRGEPAEPDPPEEFEDADFADVVDERGEEDDSLEVEMDLRPEEKVTLDFDPEDLPDEVDPETGEVIPAYIR